MKRACSFALCLMTLGLGCGHADTPESGTPTSSSSENVEGPSDEPTETAPSEADALARAEAFVRAQGYADTPPTVPPDEIAHEGIEGTIEMRQNTLDPAPVSAESEPDGTWAVAFRYVDPEYAGRGRMLMLRPGQPPQFVHQDLILPE